ncbi:MAG: hypothetical protein CL534_08610 [Ahrensia sp.]|nr:hypothetical protein [Ahrensia sp.]
MAERRINPHDRFAGYSRRSIVLHWLSAVVIVVLYMNQSPNSASFHIGLGLIAAPLLYWRVRTRFAHGYPRITELSLPFNLGARLVMFALLACIFTLMVTGPLIPLLNGEPYRIFGWLSFTIPFPHFEEAAAIAETAHAIAGHSLMILFALHMLDALTHHFFDKDTILVRMLKPIRNGK